MRSGREALGLSGDRGGLCARGRGTGGNPEVGRKAALEDEERLHELGID